MVCALSLSVTMCGAEQHDAGQRDCHPGDARNRQGQAPARGTALVVMRSGGG